MKLITVTGETIQKRITKLLKGYESFRKKNGNLRLDYDAYIKSCIDSMVEKAIFVNDDDSMIQEECNHNPGAFVDPENESKGAWCVECGEIVLQEVK